MQKRIRRNRKKRGPSLLKYKDWYRWKARSLRASFLSRLRKKFPEEYKIRKEEVPTIQEIQEWLINNEPFFCYITNEIIKNKDYIEVDHKTPLSRGGSFKLDNLGLTTRKFNKIKGNLTFEELDQLLQLIHHWDDQGQNLLNRLLRSSAIYR